MVLDGGLSTALEALGHRPAGPLWTAQLLIDNPRRVVDAHRLFVAAGADVVISSSYQASVEGFVAGGLSVRDARLALAATTSLARDAGADVVASSVGPFGAVLGDGSEYHGRYVAGWSEVRRFHRRRLEVLVDTGPDVMAIETIPSVAEAEIVLEVLASLGAPPAWLSMACRDGQHTCAGDDIVDIAGAVANYPATIAVGVNCVAPEFVDSLLTHLGEVCPLPLVAYPNLGQQWDAHSERWVGLISAEPTKHDAVLGRASLRGGCCGSGPDQISMLATQRAAAR